MRYILALFGAVFGYALTEAPPVLGLVLGFLLGMAVEQGRRVKRLENRLAEYERGSIRPETELEATLPERPVEAGAEDEPLTEAAPAPSELEWDVEEWETMAETAEAPQSPPTPPPAVSPGFAERAADRIKTFLTTGNPVVRMGLIVLFFGVAFLAKYAAANDYLPVWLRLTGVAAGGAALLIIGWRLRKTRADYALLLQGGGIGILYLTLFAAAKLYGLVPLVLAFGLMVALVGLSGVLAVLQNSMSLAAFGAAGGFLAPVLTSSGGGSHVALFAYYGLLNVGILGVALFKAWRPLNLLGAAFTFGIGSVWGAEYYRPDHFATVEPFLILFFLFYTAIAVLFARKQPPRLKGYVDGTLVFGVPVVVFSLQGAMVHRYDFGIAFSALGMSGVYIGLAALLWRRREAGMRLLTEAFLAMGVVFGSLAIPMGLEGRWTAAAWALEGAGLVWIGVRQHRLPARLFGLLLLVGSGAAVFVDGATSDGRMPVVNAIFIGYLMVAFAGFFAGWQIHRRADRLRRWERWFPVPLMLWGLLWWLGAGLLEIAIHAPMDHWIDWMIVFLAATAAAMEFASRPLAWPAFGYPSMAWLPVLMLLAGAYFSADPDGHPFTGWTGAAWAVALTIQGVLLWRMDGRPELSRFARWVHPAWHLLSLLLLIFFLSWEGSWLAGRAADAAAWRAIPWGLVPGLTALVLMTVGRRLPWPVMAREGLYRGVVPMVLSGLVILWEVPASMLPGDPAPLPYLPLLNPLDAAQAFGFLIVVRWIWEDHRGGLPSTAGPGTPGAVWTVSAGIFAWLTAATARAVHFWGGVRYDAEALFDATLFQTAVSILWSIIALGVMVWATRNGGRKPWIVGGGILGIVVAKLFIVDLAGTGTVSRIVSFLVVGALMLVIGYLSPLPPRVEAEKSGGES